MLFTVITDYEGTTLIEQFQAESVRELLDRWKNKTQALVQIETIPENYYDFTMVKDAKNAWRTSFIDNRNVQFTLNIIATSED